MSEEIKTKTDEKNETSEEIKAGEEIKTGEETQAEQKPKSKSALKKYLGWLALYLEAFILVFVGQILGGVLLSVIYGICGGADSALAKSDLWQTSSLYLMFIGIWIVTLLFFWLSKKNRPLFRLLGTGMSGNTVLRFLIGAAIGGGANAVCVLVAWLNQDIKLYFDSFRILPLLFLLVAVLIQSAAEELICRAYLYQKLMDLYQNRFWLCAVLNSLLFSVLHLGNEGVTVLSLLNIFLSGVLFTLMVYYMDSLWAAFAGHMAWNYTQNIIFGLPNSGMVVPFSIFKLDATTARNSFAYNVGFGIEGTVTADAVLLLACVLLYLWGRKRKAA